MPGYSKNFIAGKKKWQERLRNDELRQVTQARGNLKQLLLLPDEGWVLKTLGLAKHRYKLKDCKKLVLIGSGFYPYSLMSCWKRYPNIEYHGIDRDKSCTYIAKILVQSLNINNMFFYCREASIHNYSEYVDEDMILIGCDVDNIEKIYKQIINTSKAQVYMCLPHKKAPGF